MDMLKSLTGKDLALSERVAKILVDTPDVELFKRLIKQDDFLFDFVKNNVAKRIQKVCTKDNYRNLLRFFEYYSPSYDTVIGEVLFQYGGVDIVPEIKNIFLTSSNNSKAYAAKFFTFVPKEEFNEIIDEIRKDAFSDFEPLSANAIEVLSKIDDTVSKNEAIAKLHSNDEFEQYDGVKFLVNYGAKDTLPQIIEIMKKSSLSENIAAEIPYLFSIEDILEDNFDDGILVLCNIVNAIPEIISPSVVIDYNLFSVFENLYCNNLTSTSALLLRMAKDKFQSLTENDEYLYDCDKNTKDEVNAVAKLLSGVNINKLNSLLYEELFEESDFVFYALDYVDNIEELEALLDSKNQTLVLKVLTILKEKNALTSNHKLAALNVITSNNIKQIVEVL